jgi:type I restriction enzyme S subunit
MARAKKETALTPEERLQVALVPDWDWPYKLPGNWCWTTVGAINQYVGISADPTKAKNKTFELYSVPSSADNYPEIVLGADIGSTKQSVKKGDVLLCKINPRINRVWKVSKYTNHSLLASSEWIVIRNSGLISNYLMWCFRSPYFRGYMLSNVSGVGGSLMRAQPKFVQGYPVPVPPLAEQQRIVDRIESLFAKLDEAKEKAQAVVDSFETRKAAILHKAFTGELTAKWREEHGSSIRHWKECSIGDVFTHTTGKALKRNNQNGILKKYITTSNLYWGTFDFSEVREMYFTNEELEKCTAKKGDLLVCNGGDVGRAAIWNYDYDICLQNHISKLRRKTDSISVPFFYYYFMFLKINGNIAGRGIGIASLSAKDLLAIKVYLPSMTEQQQISHILDELFDKEQQSQEAAEAVLDQIDLMKKSILARAFRGELGTNDPSEESAVKLLKRTIL